MKLKKLSPMALYKLPIRVAFSLTILAIALVAVYIVASTTTPENAGPLGITAMFILLFVAILTTLTLVKMLVLRTSRVTIEGLVGISLVPVIIIALRTLRQLTIVDVLLVVIFAVLVNFYIKKAISRPNHN